MDLVGIPISLLPVLAFLALLFAMDSFKLVRPTALVTSLGAGAAAAALALVVNTHLIDSYGLDPAGVRRHTAPLVEEILKSAYLIVLLRRNRIGFMVDGVIHGFAIGAGFALVENVRYLAVLGDASAVLWITRGFGTAVMHSSTMAIFATITKVIGDRRGQPAAADVLPGLALAVGIHAAFNLFLLNPLAMTALMLIVLPLLVVYVFECSARVTGTWLGTGFDSHLELLECIETGNVRGSRVGRYLQSLRGHFPPDVVGDMLCYLQVFLELSMRAKAQLIARAAGIEVQKGEDWRENLRELRYLEKRIGRTGQLALQPLLGTGRRDLWHLRALTR